MGKYGIFYSEEERDAWLEQANRRLAEEAERLKGIGITGQEDLIAKYGALCHLWETGEVPDEDDVILTSDIARRFADNVLVIMHGGPWRAS